MRKGRLEGKKIGVLLESDFYENEIFYYRYRFPEEGAELHFLTRLWGSERLTFLGHEHRAPMECAESFEQLSDRDLAGFAAIIVPSGMVSDRLRYSEDPARPAPAVTFLRRAFADRAIVKGIICHGLWLVSRAPELVRGRRVTCHNTLVGDAEAYGAVYADEDVVVDGDLVTGRSGAHAHLFARAILDLLAER